VDTACDVVLRGSAVQPDSPEISRAIRVGAQAGAAMYRILAGGDEPLKFQLGDGPPLQKAGSIDLRTAHSGTWTSSFYLAVLSHDSALASSLCRVPVKLLRQSSTKGPEFHDLFVEAAQGVWTRARGARKLVEAALAATDPGRPDIRTPEWDQHWWVPQIKLLACLLDKRLANFGEALASALLLHKAYFSKTDEKRGETWGFLALGPMACTVLALERGLTLDVESDYLPMRLVRGDAVKD
jgi:hypothetical protein